MIQLCCGSLFSVVEKTTNQTQINDKLYQLYHGENKLQLMK
jgi:hypothetical protein